MKIDKIKIKNFKCFGSLFEVHFNDGLNIIVGDNESGKSTILEAIHIALTGVFNGRYLRNELSSYMFNLEAQVAYLESLATATPQPPPEIAIEIYFTGDDPTLAQFEGNGNSEKTKASGVIFKIEFDEDYENEYNELVKSGEVTSLPIEYYKTSWHSFARHAVTGKTIPIKSAMIDSTSSRLQNGSDLYVGRIIKDSLEDKERVSISQAHRKMRDAFMREKSVQDINEKISDAVAISSKKVSISVDLSTQLAWENSLITYIDQVPFHYIGKGEQCVVKTKLALSSKRSSEAPILLIEEPENHLSHSKLNQLIQDIEDDNGDKQVIITTHSSFVANKLGLKNMILIRNGNTTRITFLESSDFFQKLAGYDTLRLVLSSKSILVEGDSDELVVQRAYSDVHGKLPIEDGVDVISVGTSFLRFLELAKALNIPVAVVTDNDGDVSALEKKYSDYSSLPNIVICYDEEIDSGDLKIGDSPYNYNTLEPKLLKSNGLDVLNKVFETSYETDDDIRRYMRSNKTECALAIFRSKDGVSYPDYIQKALTL